MKAIKIIGFVVLAVVLIYAGTLYNKHLDQQAQQQANDAATQAQQQQQNLMDQLKITDTVVGTGAEAKSGDTVTVDYTGTLDNGQKFDSSKDHGQPFTFKLGAGQVIKGWDLGVAGMKVGGKRTLIIPPELGYGASGYPPVIPANATLHFDIELLGVK